ncbi:MAG: apolipoprotein N-acyltransferase [Rikenellaceae bacterium]
MFKKRLLAAAISILMLSLGWLGVSGLTLLVAIVPLLWISHTTEHSRKGWWSMFAWTLFVTFGWNAATIWWLIYATGAGFGGAAVVTTLVTTTGFMLYHAAIKRASRALSYTLLASAWIALEYTYMLSDFSWPWLILGNGLSNDRWAVQWYEYTGIYGGSLWILISNILIFEAWRTRSRFTAICASLVVVVPLIVSTYIYHSYQEGEQMVEVSVIQPNIDCYDKFNGSIETQKRNIIDLISNVPSTSQFIFIPETAIPEYYHEAQILSYQYIRELRDTLNSRLPNTMIVAGTNTVINYKAGEESWTARSNNSGGYYDIFNSALALTAQHTHTPVHHKARLVVGVESTPNWVFDIFKIFVIDLGGIVGQIGKGDTATIFNHNGINASPSICYEALYGQFMGEYALNGAQFFGIISNDGWWDDTPAHRHLYSMSALRAIEHRRSIARSANTGISGFINPRGDSVESLGWDKRGVLTHQISLNDAITVYARYGDYIASVARFIAAMAVLYLFAYCIKRRNYLD